MSARPFASLSAGLLARPGSARPAMRRQAFGQAPAAEDLGWDDIHGTAPAPPPVLAEWAALAQAIGAPETSAAPDRRSAFTLRLDADRHLRLRLASAVSGRSSQQIVTAALDAFLNAQPQVAAIAPKLPATPKSGEKTT